MMNTSNNTSHRENVQPVERRCENADCNAAKLLSMVPKLKSSQFVTEANVMEKPMLVNGFTTVFQVDGEAAKLANLKNVPSAGVPHPQTIYRIVPNTHAHIVNYVMVDEEGESLRKINERDPATIRKLLESQKVSADQMLKKLIAGANTTTAGSPMQQQQQPLPPPPLQPLTTNATTNPVAAAATVIQMPMRMHPNLKITAVASAETVVGAAAGGITQVIAPPAPVAVPTNTLPLITPVPLASLQSQSALAAQRAAMEAATVSPAPPQVIAEPVDIPVFDKMQAELQELRRTVALLAEAQAKNQMSQQQTPAGPSPNANHSARYAKRNF